MKQAWKFPVMFAAVTVLIGAVIAVCQLRFDRGLLYGQARLLFESGRYEEAIAKYLLFLSRYKNGEYVGRARRELALCTYIQVANFCDRTKIGKDEILSVISADMKRDIEGLGSSDLAKRIWSAFHLGRMGARAAPAIPFLIEVLSDDRKLVKGQLYAVGETGYFLKGPASPSAEGAKALVRIGKPSVEPLTAVLTEADKDWRVRSKGAWILGEIKDPRAVEPLIAALEDEVYSVRIAAIQALIQMNNRRAAQAVVGHLIVALKDDFFWMRVNAAWGLGKTRDPRAIGPLVSALRDPDPTVRRYAKRALMNMNDPSAVRPLITLLKDNSPHVRKAAAEILGTIRDPFAVDPLIDALADQDKYVRNRAANALRAMTGQNFGEEPEKWRDWSSEMKGKLNRDR